jgi:hypothetical protein
MNKKQQCVIAAIAIGLASLGGPARGEGATPNEAKKDPLPSMEILPAPGQNRQTPTGRKISLAPLPVDIYLQPNLKPTVAFTTPCIMIEKLTNGFPPVLAFESFMFEVIGNINESDLLPVRIEPVCI